jgi:hypothetical protein
MTHSGQVTAGESDRPQATILSRRRAELTGGSLRGFLVRLDSFLPLGGLVANLPRVKIISRNDQKAMSDLRVLTVLCHLEEMPRPPPILYW